MKDSSPKPVSLSTMSESSKFGISSLVRHRFAIINEEDDNKEDSELKLVAFEGYLRSSDDVIIILHQYSFLNVF